MSEDTDAAAPPGSDNGPAPAAEIERDAPSPESTETAVPSGDGDEAPDEAQTEIPEEIEFDFGGDKFRVPKGAIPDDIAEQLGTRLKGAWSSITQKNQTLAEQAKALETERTVVQRLAQLKQSELETYAKGLVVAKEIEELSQVDLNALWQSDPDRARRTSDYLAQRRLEYSRIEQEVARYGEAINAETQQHTARAMEEGRAKVAKLVKGFNEAEVVPFVVKTYGLTEEQARQWPLNPAGAAMAHDAMQWRKLQARAAPAAKPAAPPAAPVKALNAKSSPTSKDPDRMSDAEWVAWRNSQLAKRRG